LRELGQALEALTTDTPLVLVLEDLHWSDPSTVECLAYLAQRREPARLLVLGTYRPAEAVIHAHPLRRTVQELCGRGQAVELCLEPLLAEDVAAYVAGRCAGPVAGPLPAVVPARPGEGPPLLERQWGAVVGPGGGGRGGGAGAARGRAAGGRD